LGGGPTKIQEQAAKDTSVLTKQTAAIAAKKDAREQDQYDQVKPFAFSRLNGGLPFSNALLDGKAGIIARSFAPAKARLNQRFASQPDSPSGFREASMRSLDAEQARAFDDSLVNALMMDENARAEAARLITGQQQIANSVPYYTASIAGNNSIMQAPLQSPGLTGIIGGAVQGTGQAALNKIPF
jgi:hypothetical protein